MKLLRTLFFLFACIPLLSIKAYALTPNDIISSSAILMDAETGQVLFDKNMNTKMYPASTTKIMTGLLVAENSSPDEMVTVSKNALDIEEPHSAHIALSVGERLSVDNAMYALMLPSANDAAGALAEHVAGSKQEFVQKMNEKAQQIGAKNTKFVNPSGLHDPQHYSTAYDIALITKYANNNPIFMRYFGTPTYTMPATNLQPLERPFTNYQYMLVPSTRYYNKSVIGGKVGYTTEAKHTMSTVASKNGRTLICVVMSSPNRYDKFKDTQKLLDFGFDEFKKVTISKSSFSGFSVPIQSAGTPVGDVDFSSQTDFTAFLHESLRPEDVEIKFDCPSTLKQGESIPDTVSFTTTSTIEGIPPELGSIQLTPQVALQVSLPAIENAPTKKFSFSLSKIFTKTVRQILFTILLIILFLLISVLALRHHNLQKRRRRRMNRLRQRIRN